MNMMVIIRVDTNCELEKKNIQTYPSSNSINIGNWHVPVWKRKADGGNYYLKYGFWVCTSHRSAEDTK